MTKSKTIDCHGGSGRVADRLVLTPLPKRGGAKAIAAGGEGKGLSAVLLYENGAIVRTACQQRSRQALDVGEPGITFGDLYLAWIAALPKHARGVPVRLKLCDRPPVRRPASPMEVGILCNVEMELEIVTTI